MLLDYLTVLHREHVRYGEARPIRPETFLNRVYGDIKELEEQASCELCTHLKENVCTLFNLQKKNRPFRYCSEFIQH